MLFFWHQGAAWRMPLVAYTLAMAFTLVYSADHFVFDILAGWAYAAVVYALARPGASTTRHRLGTREVRRR